MMSLPVNIQKRPTLTHTEAEKGHSKNNFQIRRSISDLNIFLQILVEKLFKSKKLLQS